MGWPAGSRMFTTHPPKPAGSRFGDSACPFRSLSDANDPDSVRGSACSGSGYLLFPHDEMSGVECTEVHKRESFNVVIVVEQIRGPRLPQIPSTPHHVAFPSAAAPLHHLAITRI